MSDPERWAKMKPQFIIIGVLAVTIAAVAISRKYMISDWPFSDSKNVAVFTTTHVVKDKQPILYVFHDADDGSWQFHYAGNKTEKDSMIVTLEEILTIDPSIADLADMPSGQMAYRKSKDSPWIRKPHTISEE